MLILHKAHVCPHTPPLTKGAAHAEQSALSHALLDEVLKKLGLSPSPILKTKQGRPYFKDHPLVDFSLSHTDGLAVCALCQADEAPPPRVGVDTERLSSFDREKLEAFANRFFGTCERRFVLGSEEPRAAFTRVFTQKEAYAKYRGEGLGAHLSKTDTCAPDFEKANGVRFHTYREGDCFISLCVSSACKDQPLFWEDL